MTKKRIADLLKEEVEKSSVSVPAAAKLAPSNSASDSAKPSASDSASDSAKPSAKPSVTKASAAKASAAKRTTSKTSASQSTSKSASKSGSPASASTKAAATKSSAVKAADTQTTPDLAPKVADLEAKLNEALQQSTDQISALQGDIDTHQSRIFELKDSLEKTENDGKKKDAQIKKLTDDLEAAKQTIVELTDKSKLDAKQLASQPATADKTAAQPSDRASLSVRQSPYANHKSIPEYAIQRGTPLAGQGSSMMNDDDLGWVD